MLLIICVLIIRDSQYFNVNHSGIDLDLASKFGGFIGGFVGLFWSVSGVLFIYATFKEQQRMSLKQNFESSFFGLINTYHTIVNSTSGSNNENVGKIYFTYVLQKIRYCDNKDCNYFFDYIVNRGIPETKSLLNEFHTKYPAVTFKYDEVPDDFKVAFTSLNTELDSNKPTKLLSKEYYIAQFEYVYEFEQDKIAHIFRFIYHIFKYVISEEKNHNDTSKYLDFLQAQMSSDELGLIFYNALSKYSKSSSNQYQFYNWLEKYHFFENINKSSLLHESHTEYYPNTKFKFNF